MSGHLSAVDDLSLDDLGDQICELAAHIAAATYRWLTLLARFDEQEGGLKWGCRSTAHWLSWRCGYDLRSAYERVRVACALGSLPLISASFAKGEISYSKVRAITRIATPQTEEELLMFARHGTASHVEKIVRGYRRVERIEARDGLKGDTARADAGRFLRLAWTDDGELEIRGRVPADAGAIVEHALEQLVDHLREDLQRSAEHDNDVPDRGELLADALVGLVRGATVRASDPEVVVHIDAEALSGDQPAPGHLDNGAPIASEAVRRLACDAGIVPLLQDEDGKVLSVGRRTRRIPAALRRALAARDTGCQFPGCPSRMHLHRHHIKHWADGGDTSLQNLVLLCSHHHGLVHEGGFTLTICDGELVFRRPDGRAVGARPIPGRASAIVGLVPGIDAETTVPRWAGERCDYGIAVEGLLRRRVNRSDLCSAERNSAPR